MDKFCQNILGFCITSLMLSNQHNGYMLLEHSIKPRKNNAVLKLYLASEMIVIDVGNIVVI